MREDDDIWEGQQGMIPVQNRESYHYSTTVMCLMEGKKKTFRAAILQS